MRSEAGNEHAVKMVRTFEVGDLVWAKLKGFSPWPGRVSIPAVGMKCPRNHQQCVYFFGTSNYGWVKGSDMRPYQAFKKEMIRLSNTSAFKAAVKQIEGYIANPEEFVDFVIPLQYIKYRNHTSGKSPPAREKAKKSTVVPASFPDIDGPIQNGTEENRVDDASDQSKKNYPNNTADSDSDQSVDFDIPLQYIKYRNHKSGKSPPTREKAKKSTVVPAIRDVVVRLRRERVYECALCAAVCASSQQLNKHQLTHVHVFSAYVPLVRTEVQIYKCKTCGQDFQQQKECQLHELKHGLQDRYKENCAPNSIVKPFKCEECGALFVLESTLGAHSAVHDPFPHLCHCGIGYFREKDFRAHKQAVHRNDITCIPKIDQKRWTKNGPKTKGPKTKQEIDLKRRKRKLPSPESCDENIDSPDMERPEERELSQKVFKTKLKRMVKCKTELVNKEEQMPKIKTNRGRRERPKRNMTEFKSKMKLKNGFGEKFDRLRKARERFACPAPGCKKYFPYRRLVVSHYKTHLSVNFFECEHCHIKYKYGRSYENHLKTHGLEQKKYICDYCDARFYTKLCISLHMIMHMGLKPYFCEVCKARFTQSVSLRVHSKIHLGIMNLICPHCNKEFRNYISLVRHECIHRAVKRYKCTYCGKDFISPSSLTRHIITHTGNKVVRTKQCEICFKKFYNNSDVQRHVLHVHASKYECNECGSIFYVKANLREHLGTIHMPFVYCGMCKAGFSSNRALEKHKSEGCHKLDKKKKRLKGNEREPLEIRYSKNKEE